ncbi:hypothetical protein [Baaleninema sp.]|uniref:hypothetical protein n=1 Tax=Baaleninema sp. TaxID=3101197 RepID=UPI003D04095E
MTSPTDPDDETDLDRSLEDLQAALSQLKLRHAQVQRDRERRQQLKAELQRLSQQLEQVELRLESQLFSWREVREPFWQAVRFLGLGVVVGWILKSCAG